MKPLARVHQPVYRTPLLDPETCAQALAMLKAVPEPYWYRRTSLQQGRGMQGASCDYGWLTKHSMPKAVSAMIQQSSPVSPDMYLADWAVNRYLPGQFIGPHRDRDPYPFNVVVPLQALGDGVVVGGEFFPDEVGWATIFEGATPVHEVPPVKNERYVLIYLLAEK